MTGEKKVRNMFFYFSWKLNQAGAHTMKSITDHILPERSIINFWTGRLGLPVQTNVRRRKFNEALKPSD